MRPTSALEEPHWGFSDDIYSVGYARGTYHRLQFVIRLRDDLYSLIKSDPSRIANVGSVDFKTVSAFSTYFHETIHWWQHIGSTTGLMLSLAYPAHSHVNRPYLRKILETIGPKKSLRSFLVNNQTRLSAESRKELNYVLNSWHDVEFNNRIILDPLRLNDVVKNPFFECVGHSLDVALSQMIWLLAATFDPEMNFLPEIRHWDSEFAALRKRQVEGFYHGSPIGIVPMGAIRIFEGQSRFSQAQYLHLASGGKSGWKELRQMLSFEDPYSTAFEYFLKWAQLDRPDSPVHPTVHLFLLVCDLAINPSDGFPFDIENFENFIRFNDPSFRFMRFSSHIAKNPKLKSAIRLCNKTEYEEVSAILCQSLGCRGPIEISKQISMWAEHHPALRLLLQEDDTFDFQLANLPIRVCFARFIRFAQDRLLRPDFFCWPAMHFVGGTSTNSNLAESIQLFTQHQALFVAGMDGEIRPTILRGREQSKIRQTFNDFYNANILFQMTTQWTVNDGPFNYDFTWLTPRYTPEIIKPWVDTIFENAFGVSPDRF